MAGAAIIGSAITTLPWLVSRANIDGLWGVDVVLIPGMIVGLVISRNVHDYSLPVVLIVSACVLHLVSLPSPSPPSVSQRVSFGTEN
jgi:hypothetical protein